MSPLRCGAPTPNGPCRRLVRSPGAPCGVDHRIARQARSDIVAAAEVIISRPAEAEWYVEELEEILAGHWPGDHSAFTELFNDDDVPEEFVVSCARDRNPLVRAGAAASSRLSPALLEELSHDSDQDVLDALALNEHTPPGVLTRLATIVAEHPDDGMLRSLRAFLMGNPSTPDTVVETLMLDGGDLEWVTDRANLTPELARAALNAAYSDQTASASSDEGWWMLAVSVADHPDLPDDVKAEALALIPTEELEFLQELARQDGRFQHGKDLAPVIAARTMPVSSPRSSRPA
ncbi:MAG TPA: hypothetical protein VFP54_05985 [Acidimicrobiales bacterium]|nr:hypothetical protein [Acidimicrobiales bacterium]